MSVKSSQSTIRPVYYILLISPFFLIGWIGDWSQAIKRGNAHYEAEAYDAALEAYQSAAENRPEDAIARYNLGTTLYQKKQFEKAADEFRRSLDAADPVRRAQGYYNLGNAQVQLNDIEGAIRSYKSALRLNPADLDAKHNLELVLEKLEQKSQQNRSESEDEDKNQPGPATEIRTNRIGTDRNRISKIRRIRQNQSSSNRIRNPLSRKLHPKNRHRNQNKGQHSSRLKCPRKMPFGCWRLLKMMKKRFRRRYYKSDSQDASDLRRIGRR